MQTFYYQIINKEHPLRCPLHYLNGSSLLLPTLALPGVSFACLELPFSWDLGIPLIITFRYHQACSACSCSCSACCQTCLESFDFVPVFYSYLSPRTYYAIIRNNYAYKLEIPLNMIYNYAKNEEKGKSK